MEKERMDYEALKPILYGRDEFKTREHFGTSLPKHYDAFVVDSIASRMITKCKIWAENWETVQEAIAPEVEEIKMKMIKDRISKLSPKEVDMYLNYLLRQKEELVKTNL
ncbi:MAG: hypothetical protein J6A70_04815 [Prevotella sp.]|nr:hypothetical protein [Prevotella sp.]